MAGDGIGQARGYLGKWYKDKAPFLYAWMRQGQHRVVRDYVAIEKNIYIQGSGTFPARLCSVTACLILQGVDIVEKLIWADVTLP